jgi:hypothetical protein
MNTSTSTTTATTTTDNTNKPTNNNDDEDEEEQYTKDINEVARVKPGLITESFLTIHEVKNKVSKIPLIGMVSIDGYGHLSLFLYFSGFQGPDALKDIAPVYGVEPGDEKYMIQNLQCLWTAATVPIPHVLLEQGEMVWNTHKYPQEYEGAIQAGIIINTGKTTDMNYYKDLPIVQLVKVKEVDLTKWGCKSNKYCYECSKYDDQGLQRCSGCKSAQYCSQQCQRKAWKHNHKYFCPLLRREQQQKS